MTEKTWRIFAVLVIIGCLSVFIRWQCLTGWLLGCAVSVLTFKITEHYCDTAIRMRNAGGSMGHFMINFTIWAAVLIFCALADSWFSILACAVGLTTVKMAIIIDSVVNRE